MNRSCSLITSSSSSFSSSSKPETKYDVFLSFRGEDTRKSFTSHLYAALCQKGIYTFLDDDKLERGKAISPGLLKAIEDSQCSIVVISRNYASSSWCLDELVMILQCMKASAQIVLPIFYHVDPSHVRKQIGNFGEAFQKHELDFSDDIERVQSWRNALKEVANLAGWHLHDRDEAKFLQDFVVEVSSKLGVARLNISEDLFGMDSRLEKLNNCVCNSSLDDVGFIGICGMGGIGKTTLAKAYYDWKSSQFECSSFLANVREVCEKENNGLVYLQNLLISDILNGEPTKIRDARNGKDIIRSRLRHKNVLIVFDDVDKLDQLKALAEKQNWFGSGSRIIITTRDESLLTSTYKDCTIYRAEHLNYNEGLQLFSWKAFKSSHPLDNFTKLSRQVITYANGLPLALEVLGSFLCGKTINEWRSALDRLKEYPKKEIVKVLQVTFDGLEETEKSIFLDIACFFNGHYKDDILEIMDSCGFFPEIGIKVLIDKSLLHIRHDNKLWMHDLLEEMGKEIVREKSHNLPGRRSRLWDMNDLFHVLDNNTGTEEIEAIVCRYVRGWKKLSFEAFSNMKKLRLLIIGLSWLKGCDITPHIEYLSNDLRYLEWSAFPSKDFPSSFQPDRLVVLKLWCSNIKELWSNHIKQPFYNLKIIDLSYSRNFSKIKDFGMFPNLEKLILEYCTNLLEVHPSITILKRLTFLNLKSCTSLESLPTSIDGLKSLKVLDLDGCKSLSSLPEDLRHLNSLEELHVRGTAVSDLPATIVLLKKLRILSWGGRCLASPQVKNMFNILVGKGLSLTGLYSLKKLDLSSCSLVTSAFPEDFGCLVCLEDLNLSNNYFSCLPAGINKVSKLRHLDVQNCKYLKSLGPELPSSLEIVRADQCTSLDTFLDPSNQCNLLCSAICVDCFDLVRRQGSKRTAFTSLKRYLQNPSNPSKRFEVVLPGNEIPIWFTYRSLGPSISLPLDPNWCNSKWTGFALSVWFAVNTHSSFCCEVRINGQDWGFGLVKFPINGLINFDHLWLLYLPRDIYFQTEWQNNDYNQIEFSFKTNTFFGRNDAYLYFRQCGARLVYEQDIEDLNRTANDCVEFPDGDVDFFIKMRRRKDLQQASPFFSTI